MSSPVVTNEIAAAMGRCFTGGAGPRHTDLTANFVAAGLDDIAPYIDGQPNKETRVRQTLVASRRTPSSGRSLLDALLSEMRAHRCFNPSSEECNPVAIRSLQEACARSGLSLSDDGVLTTAGPIDLDTGGRTALDEQLKRLQLAVDDPALMLGTAKELLETTAKFVLEELNLPIRKNADFNELWHHARDRLGIHPNSIPTTAPGSAEVKKVLGSAWTIAEQVNTLRCREGTGHGRTLPTGVSPEVAMFVVREACGVAELTLRTLDRQLGRR